MVDTTETHSIATLDYNFSYSTPSPHLDLVELPNNWIIRNFFFKLYDRKVGFLKKCIADVQPLPVTVHWSQGIEYRM